MSVVLVTSLGKITIELFYKDCPLCSKNFLKLCKIKYYNNNLFYNVQKDYIAQCGSPTHSDINNKSIYGIINPENNFFKDEIFTKYKHNQKGLLCSANIGPNMNTSTFYLTLTSNNLISLNGKHSIFGKVTNGFETLDKINEAYCDEENRPYKNIRILHTIILSDPFDDIEGMIIPSKSPEYKRDFSDFQHLDDDLEIETNKFLDENDTEEKIKEKLKDKESKNKTVILELLEDLPNSSSRPQKNVLFVCRLNPITVEKDLINLFEQFGKIKSCQIIRDKKTKQSLKYGFIEFYKVEDCEKAYIKMNGALIDDCRIKVDFSQSVIHNTNYKNNKNYNNNNNEEKSSSDNDNDDYRYKFRDREINMLNDSIHYKFQDNPKNSNRKNEQYVFEDNYNNKSNDNRPRLRSRSNSHKHHKTEKHECYRDKKYLSRKNNFKNKNDDRYYNELSYKNYRNNYKDEKDYERKRKKEY